MGFKCSVAWCNAKKKSGNMSSLALFSFPTDEQLRLKWVQFVGGGSDWQPLKHSKVCEAHFREKFIMTGPKNRKNLSSNAVPGN